MQARLPLAHTRQIADTAGPRPFAMVLWPPVSAQKLEANIWQVSGCMHQGAGQAMWVAFRGCALD
jgi:hypothetical protein